MWEKNWKTGVGLLGIPLVCNGSNFINSQSGLHSDTNHVNELCNLTRFIYKPAPDEVSITISVIIADIFRSFVISIYSM